MSLTGLSLLSKLIWKVLLKGFGQTNIDFSICLNVQTSIFLPFEVGAKFPITDFVKVHEGE